MDFRKGSYISYIAIFCLVLLMMSVPLSFVENLRGGVIRVMSPLFNSIQSFKTLTQGDIDPESPYKLVASEEMKRLRLENSRLHTEVSRLNEVYPEIAFFEESGIIAVPAKVIYRDSAFWNHSLWLNLGKADNERFGAKIISRNSPVVQELTVLGVIDYVGEHQSRVRLITDSGLNPSVRAFRGKPQQLFLKEQVKNLAEGLFFYRDKLSEEIFNGVLRHLELLQDSFEEEAEYFLAKGEMQGCLGYSGRTSGHILKGVGFNYDYADDKGPARDLRSGKVRGEKGNYPTMPILAKNDLLVTTGMDGVFPEGLRVGIVTKVYPLREGAYTYDLEAQLTVTNLDSLSSVFVMPPVGFDLNDQVE